MRIDFESSGGYANLQLEYNTDTDALPAQLSEELEGLVASSGIRDLSATEFANARSNRPDVISYQLTLTEDGARKSFNLDDVTAPPSLRPLLSRLYQLAIQSRQRGTSV